MSEKTLLSARAIHEGDMKVRLSDDGKTVTVEMSTTSFKNLLWYGADGARAFWRREDNEEVKQIVVRRENQYLKLHNRITTKINNAER